MHPTPSQANAQDVREFITPIHNAPYRAIDPALVKLPQPYVVCIIGGRGSVGSGLARSYAAAGASGIVLCARSLEALELVSQEVQIINPSTKILVVQCDVTSAESVATAAARTKSEFGGGLDVVIVNSGYSGQFEIDITKGNPNEFRRPFQVNTFGAYYAAHYFIPLLMATPNGAKSFIVISSISAPTVSGPVAHTQYCVSKIAQARIIEMISEQPMHKGLFCCSVHPGGVVSEFAEVMPQQYRHLLVDDPSLAGSFCVWLTKDKEKSHILNGRFLSCKWDVEQLTRRFDEIVAKDLLKFRLVV